MSQLFHSMDLPESLLQALDAQQLTVPTSIQAEAIPKALAGSDLIGSAQTGTGKTLAFCLPLLTHVLVKRGSRALILAPTREIALQVKGVIDSLTQRLRHVRSVVLIGGVDMGRQVQQLRQKPTILVATPGRLADHMRRRSIELKTVDFVVLDEGDRMLDMGFERQINEIMRSVGQPDQAPGVGQ